MFDKCYGTTGTTGFLDYFVRSYSQLEEEYDFFINCCYESVWFIVGWGSSKRYFPVYTPFEATLRFLECYKNRFTKFIVRPLNFFYIKHNKNIRSVL